MEALFILAIILFCIAYWTGYVYGKREGIEHQKDLDTPIIAKVVKELLKERKKNYPDTPEGRVAYLRMREQLMKEDASA